MPTRGDGQSGDDEGDLIVVELLLLPESYACYYIRLSMTGLYPVPQYGRRCLWVRVASTLRRKYTRDFRQLPRRYATNGGVPRLSHLPEWLFVPNRRIAAFLGAVCRRED